MLIGGLNKKKKKKLPYACLLLFLLNFFGGKFACLLKHCECEQNKSQKKKKKIDCLTSFGVMTSELTS